MKTYQAIKTEIAKLEKQAQALRQSELKNVIAEVRKAIADYGLTPADLGLGAAKAKRGPGRRKAAKKTVGTAKYRDPVSGSTWTGRGRPPAWIAAAKNRDAFVIGVAAPAKPAAKKPAPARKAKPAAKPAAKRGKPAAKKKVARKSKRAKMLKTPAVKIESGVATQ